MCKFMHTHTAILESYVECTCVHTSLTSNDSVSEPQVSVAQASQNSWSDCMTAFEVRPLALCLWELLSQKNM